MVNWLTQLFEPMPQESAPETTPHSGSNCLNGSTQESTSSGKRRITAYATASGSVYHVDHVNKMVRRASGANQPTNYQGPDHTWKRFESVVRSMDGGLGFVWDVSEPNSGKAHFRTTITSAVVAELEFVEGEVFG